MGQRLSCGQRNEDALFTGVANGDLEVVEAMIKEDPTVLEDTSGHARLSPLHVAAINGRIEVDSLSYPLIFSILCRFWWRSRSMMVFSGL